MNKLTRTVIALSGALMLTGAAAGAASANYSGLADGEPGPADVWAATHPDFGKVTHFARPERDRRPVHRISHRGMPKPAAHS